MARAATAPRRTGPVCVCSWIAIQQQEAVELDAQLVGGADQVRPDEQQPRRRGRLPQRDIVLAEDLARGVADRSLRPRPRRPRPGRGGRAAPIGRGSAQLAGGALQRLRQLLELLRSSSRSTRARSTSSTGGDRPCGLEARYASTRSSASSHAFRATEIDASLERRPQPAIAAGDAAAASSPVDEARHGSCLRRRRRCASQRPSPASRRRARQRPGSGRPGPGASLSSSPAKATWPPASRAISCAAAASTERQAARAQHRVEAADGDVAERDRDRADRPDPVRLALQRLDHRGDPLRLGRLEADHLEAVARALGAEPSPFELGALAAAWRRTPRRRRSRGRSPTRRRPSSGRRRPRR